VVEVGTMGGIGAGGGSEENGTFFVRTLFIRAYFYSYIRGPPSKISRVVQKSCAIASRSPSQRKVRTAVIFLFRQCPVSRP